MTSSKPTRALSLLPQDRYTARKGAFPRAAAALLCPLLMFLPAAAKAATDTTVALTPSPNPAVFGETVTLTATVTPAAATGKVTFYDGASILGIAALSSGQARLTTALLNSGSRVVRAYYGGDANHAPGAATVTQTVGTVPQSGFAVPVTYNAGLVEGNLSVGTNVSSVAVGDFNGDGKPDLVTVDSDGSFQGELSVLLGTGQGNFRAPLHVTAPVAAAPRPLVPSLGPVSANLFRSFVPSAAAVGDFNGDGKPDLAVVGTNSSRDLVLGVLPGKGDGSFLAPLAVMLRKGSPVQSRFSVLVGDFSGNGKADIVVTNSRGGVSFLPGNGDGTFRPVISLDLPSSGAAVGDFNGDGKADLVLSDNSGIVNILLSTGNGSFEPSDRHDVGGILRSLAVGDFNGDGKADIAIANYGEMGAGDVSVMLGQGDGTFHSPTAFTAVRNPISIVVADFNGDGKSDIAVANDGMGAVSVMLGKGDGSFRTATIYGVHPGSDSVAMAVGDFNGDGRADLAVAPGHGPTVSISLGLNPADPPPANQDR